ncbi:MAG TPA: hypothetical protein VIS52_02160 [Motiliproteus sp.]
MSKPRFTPPEYPDQPDFPVDDESLGITHQDYQRARRRQTIRQGIDDYFDRKHLSDIEDWFGSME